MGEIREQEGGGGEGGGGEDGAGRSVCLTAMTSNDSLGGGMGTDLSTGAGFLKV